MAILIIAQILDDLAAAVDTARKVEMTERWANALEAAWDHLLQVETIEIDDHDALTYHSESGATYQANGTCQCKAHLSGQPCKHRAASKLVRNALKAQEERAKLLQIARHIDAGLQLGKRLATERAKVYAEVDELFAS